MLKKRRPTGRLSFNMGVTHILVRYQNIIGDARFVLHASVRLSAWLRMQSAVTPETKGPVAKGSRVIECLAGTRRSPDSDSLGNKNRYRIGREGIGIGTGFPDPLFTTTTGEGQ